IHVRFLTGQQLRDCRPFFLGLVSQHRPGDEIADAVDARKIRLEALIDDDAAGALLKRHARLLQSQPRRERPAPHCNEDLIALEEEIFALALGIEDRKSTRLNSSHVAISYAV